MDLNELTLDDLRFLLARPNVSPFEGDAASPTLRCRIRTSSWVPDGLALQGYPRVEGWLTTLDDYPSMDMEWTLPEAAAGMRGIDALDAWCQSAHRFIAEARSRCRSVEKEIDAMRADLQRPAAPWHLVDFDPYKQTVRTTQSKLTVSFLPARATRDNLGLINIADLVDSKRGRRSAPWAWRGAYVDQIERGGHRLRIQRARGKPLSFDLLSDVDRETSSAPS